MSALFKKVNLNFFSLIGNFGYFKKTVIFELWCHIEEDVNSVIMGVYIWLNYDFDLQKFHKLIFFWAGIDRY